LSGIYNVLLGVAYCLA